MLRDGFHLHTSWRTTGLAAGAKDITVWPQSSNTIDGRNPAPVEVGSLVYTIIFRALYIPGNAGFLPPTVVTINIQPQFLALSLKDWNLESLIFTFHPWYHVRSSQVKWCCWSLFWGELISKTNGMKVEFFDMFPQSYSLRRRKSFRKVSNPSWNSELINTKYMTLTRRYWRCDQKPGQLLKTNESMLRFNTLITLPKLAKHTTWICEKKRTVHNLCHIQPFEHSLIRPKKALERVFPQQFPYQAPGICPARTSAVPFWHPRYSPYIFL